MNDEYYAYDDGEDGEIQLTREKTNQQKSLRQQAAFTNNSTKGIGGFSGVSNNEKVSSANANFNAFKWRITCRNEIKDKV